MAPGPAEVGTNTQILIRMSQIDCATELSPLSHGNLLPRTTMVEKAQCEQHTKRDLRSRKQIMHAHISDKSQFGPVCLCGTGAAGVTVTVWVCTHLVEFKIQG